MIDDPLSLLMQGIWLLAAGMYPLGFMFGTCSECCCRNNTCQGFDLEEAFGGTRTSGRIEVCGLVNAGGGLLEYRGSWGLTFSSCYGSGAAGVLTPTGVSLTNPGSGYAKFARVEPTLTITGGGEGATFEPVFELSYEECDSTYPIALSNVPAWRIVGVPVAGGAGYVDGEVLVIGGQLGDVEESQATLVMRTARSVPTLSAEAPLGDGAIFSIAYEQVPEQMPPRWRIASIAVINGGAGYENETGITFTLGYGDVQSFSGFAIVRTAEGGDGIIQSVEVVDGGVYYKETPDFVEVVEGGKYYREDQDGVPYVSGVNVSAPYSGVEIAATVNSDTGSEAFGQISGLTVVSGSVLPSSIGTPRGVSAGCRVYGPGIAPGTVVVETEEVYDPPKVPFVLGDKQGCCEIKYQGTFCTGGNLTSVITERVVRTEQACDEREAELLGRNCGDGLNLEDIIIQEKTWTECEDCLLPPNGPNPVGPVILEGGRQPGAELVGFDITIDPPPTGEIGPCLTFCGTGGKCGPFRSRLGEAEEEFGPYGTGVAVGDFTIYPEEYRRNCVRWVCRCYEGTGNKSKLLPDTSQGCCTVTYTYRQCGLEGEPVGDEIVEVITEVMSEEGCQSLAEGLAARNCPWDGQSPVSAVVNNWTAGIACDNSVIETDQPEFPDPADWYTVASTTIIGGPTTNGLDLSQELENASGKFTDYLEHDWLFYLQEWDAAEDNIRCAVYAFVFYGESQDTYEDPCNFKPTKHVKETTSGDNVYLIYPCNRCD